jgi:hypothetical protein
MSAMLLQRAERQEPIRGPVSLLGRLAALGVGQSIERKNSQARMSAVMDMIGSLPQEQQAMAKLAVLTGGDLTGALLSQRGQDLTARGQDIGAEVARERIGASAAEGAADRASREGIADKSLLAAAANTAATVKSRERLAAASNAIRAEANRIKKAENLAKANATGTKEANELVDDFRAESTQFKVSADAFRRVQASAETPTPAGDLSLIFAFMKVLDPGSTVREGEFAQVGASGSLPTQVQRIFDQWQTGQRLTDEQRNDVVSRAGALFARARDAHIDLEDQYLKIGERRGVNPDVFAIDYVGDLRDYEPGAGSTPAGDGLTDEQRAAAVAQGLL